MAPLRSAAPFKRAAAGDLGGRRFSVKNLTAGEVESGSNADRFLFQENLLISNISRRPGTRRVCMPKIFVASLELQFFHSQVDFAQARGTGASLKTSLDL